MITAMPAFFQTLQAFNTPQLQPNNYTFIYHRLTVVILPSTGLDIAQSKTDKWLNLLSISFFIVFRRLTVV